MKCTEARQRWHLCLDNESEDVELKRHLAECEACRSYASRMQRLVELLDELHEETETLVPSTDPAAERNTYRIRPRWSPAITRSLLRIAAVIVIAVGAGLWYRAERIPNVVERLPSTVVPAMGITLGVDSRNRFIVVPSPGAEPNVQTYWLYPSVPVTGSQERS